MAVTQNRLKEILHYNSTTGVFVWLKQKAHRNNAGDIAGSVGKAGYRHIGIDGVSYRAHRLAWLYVYGFIPSQLDHKNGIRDNNFISNLKEKAQAENMKNLALIKRGTKSMVKGVNPHPQSGKWRASIHLNGKRISLGLHHTKEDAISVRRNAEVKYGFVSNNRRANYECV